MHVLVLESERTLREAQSKLLTTSGFHVATAASVQETREKVSNHDFAAIVMAWNAPALNREAFIRFVRSRGQSATFILMSSPVKETVSRAQALLAGADEVYHQPFQSESLVACLRNGVRQFTPEPTRARRQRRTQAGYIDKRVPPCVAVCIAASTGGPGVVEKVLKGLVNTPAVILIVQHGPKWISQRLVERFSKALKKQVHLATGGRACQPGLVFVAPGDSHLEVDQNFRLRLSRGEPENGSRPSADPLFRSAAKAFGKHCVGVVLTGLGRDGSEGCTHIDEGGGLILVQDPAEAVAPYMPRSVTEVCASARSMPSERIAMAITRSVQKLSVQGTIAIAPITEAEIRSHGMPLHKRAARPSRRPWSPLGKAKER